MGFTVTCGKPAFSRKTSLECTLLLDCNCNCNYKMEQMVIMWCLLWNVILLGVLSSSHALEINMDTTQYNATSGSDVKLACKYTYAMNTIQRMEIEWTVEPEDENILWFTHGRLYPVQYKPLEGRVSFASTDYQNGDASIIIRNVRESDSKIYRCMVKNLPELDMKKVQLTVIDVPIQPDLNSPKYIVIIAATTAGLFLLLVVLNCIIWYKKSKNNDIIANL
ncbi:coxsackievirus and adenovirus receptor homolog [Vanacampus margaritifer]